MIATRRSLGPIPNRKDAAAEQRRSEGPEEIRADLVSCEQQALGNRSGVPFDSQGLFPGVAGEQIVDDAGALDTRNRLNLFEHAVVQVGPLRGDTEGRRGCDFHHKDPLRPESRIDVGHVPPASDEQTGADEQNDRQRKLRYHEGAADSTAGCSARDTSATLLAGRTQIAAHRRHRWRQSHQDSRQKRHGQGQPEDAEIEAHFVQTRQVARAEGADEVECLPRPAACQSGLRRRPSTTLSVSSCRTIRPALAPSAARTAISRARAVLRASERLVTLAAAITNTQNTAPPSIHNANRDWGPTM